MCVVIFEFLVGGLIAFIVTLPALFLPVAGERQKYHLFPLFCFHLINISALYALLIFMFGSVSLGCAVSVILFYIFSVISCIKYDILQEPIYFSDAISLGTLLKNPKFFIFSIPFLGWVALIVIALCIPTSLWYCFSINLYLRIYALVLICFSYLGYKVFFTRYRITEPDWQRDIGRFGVLGMLIAYWKCWKEQVPPVPLSVKDGKAKADIVLVVQCESFASPSIFCDPKARNVSLPFFRRAEHHAVARGSLLVSGFGAYTMRTEYGVLFGRTEAELGFCRFDPFLTAQRDQTYALPYQLKAAGYHTVFMHPHSLEFYGRGQLMPEIGFDVVDDCAALQSALRAETYISDTTLADEIIERLETATSPLFLYAVTMENHAPWPGTPSEALGHYLRHLQNSDAMLGQLMKWFEGHNKSALLVFFGDHRPSIRGIVYQDKKRSTPYVAVSFPIKATEPIVSDLTPEELHHLIRDFSVEFV